MPSLARLERLVKRVERTAARFDRWESCLSWLPVTEDGDPGQHFGFLGSRARHLSAIWVDTSERDDPDYELLVRSRRCDSEPGEAVDRAARRDADGRLAALREDVQDLVEPVGEITRFDECMYTVGVQQRPGYVFRDRRGHRSQRAALSLDLRGPRLPEMSVMATSGEEPPQIECNEDAASGEDDD